MKKISLHLPLSLLFACAASPAAAGQAFMQAAVMAGPGVPEAVPQVPSFTLAAINSVLSPAQKKRADMLISVFENSTTALQYSYIEDIHDGRGYTAGRAGFCSGCGDLLEVAERYTRIKPANPLKKYLPRLRELARLHSPSTKGLKDLEAAWRQAALDQDFCGVQDEVSDELYCLPALKYAESLGLKKDLSRIALYEAAIQHGMGEDHDSVQNMAKRASEKAAPPSEGGDETAWLGQFLAERRYTLAHAADPATQEAWAGSVGRADVMLAIFAAGNMDFSGPITVNPYGDQFVIQ